MATCFSIDVSCGYSVPYMIAIGSFQTTQDTGHHAEESICPKFVCSILEKTIYFASTM